MSQQTALALPVCVHAGVAAVSLLGGPIPTLSPPTSVAPSLLSGSGEADALLELSPWAATAGGFGGRGGGGGVGVDAWSSAWVRESTLGVEDRW